MNLVNYLDVASPYIPEFNSNTFVIPMLLLILLFCFLIMVGVIIVIVIMLTKGKKR